VIHFVANLTVLFTDLPFFERFEAAAESGFHGVEFLFPYQSKPEEIQHLLHDQALELVLFNLPPGDISRHEWGLLSDPNQKMEFKRDFETALHYADVMQCHLLNVMFGQRLQEATIEKQMECTLENLTWAAPMARDCGVILLVEPLNPIDFSNYALTSTDQAIQLVQTMDTEQVKLQFDVYHSLMCGEDPFQIIRNHLSSIKHIPVCRCSRQAPAGFGQVWISQIFLGS